MPALEATGLRVLVVEDRAESADCLAMLLRMYGHEAQVALDGPTALDAAQNWLPDVVLLDLAMPGMSGYDVARELVARPPAKMPFLIALTGYGREEDRQKSAAAGIDLHLLKPVDPDQLQAVLARFQSVVCG